MNTYGKKAGLPPEKRRCHSLKHAIATHPLDAGGELLVVQAWVGHQNVQNTPKYAQLTTPRREAKARRLFADHRAVSTHWRISLGPPRAYGNPDLTYESPSGTSGEACPPPSTRP